MLKNKGLSFGLGNSNLAQSLFQTEGFFWLTTAIATGFAVEELAKYPHTVNGQEIVQTERIVPLFNEYIKHKAIDTQRLQQVKQWTVQNVGVIVAFNQQSMVFRTETCLPICKSFTTYWLMFKLIEAEGQEVLGHKEMQETYQFIDTVLADTQELDEIEKKYFAHQGLTDDEKIYLRSHWQRVQFFWSTLQQDLSLLEKGLMRYQPLIG